MRSRTLSALILFIALAFISVGCEKPPVDGPKENSGENTPAAEDGSDDLDVTSAATPEGVTNRFFDAFFSGKDEEAQSYLTGDAKKATEGIFAAQASDTIRWNVTKVEKDGNNAYVFVSVSDLNDEGDLASEELIFALRNENEQWGVAGFSAGDMIVNFEEKALETLDPNSPENAEPARVSQKTATDASVK